MSDSAHLLIELGCEELPPKALDGIREALFRATCDGLEKNQIAFSREASRAFSSPRRLALLLADVAAGQPDQELERRGPSVRAAFDGDGKPTAAALGFARSVGRDVGELETIKTDKGEWLFCRVHQAGQSLDSLVYDVLEQAVRQLPVPKPMRWADKDFSFVRPVHWLVVMHGERVIAGRLFGLEAGDSTRGHRIHAPGPHRIGQASDYADILESARVLADQDKRRERIRAALHEADEQVLIDPDLLDEVNNLVEWPVAVKCSFENDFLEVPHEALIASMQDHQKFFPVRDAEDPSRVSNRFVAVSNIDSRDFNQVRAGYERVIRPRLADARFFLEQDRKQALEAYLAALDRVVFQQKIGTVGDKSRRLKFFSTKLAEKLRLDPALCERAALLSKCDLMTQMVGEFPELQGTMGRHYALSSGETPEVAGAIGEHYHPRFAGDAIPATAIGQVVSIADRADTLYGIFAADLKPTGNKDPFALRRAALGLIRILLEAGMDVTIRDVLRMAADGFEAFTATAGERIEEVHAFIVDRLRQFFIDRGHATDLVKAVLVSNWSTVRDLDLRLRALEAFMEDPAAASLAASNKRIGNILKKSGEEDIGDIDEDIFVFEAEKRLFDEIVQTRKDIAPGLKAGDYTAALARLAGLRENIDRFFDEVMVMDEDRARRSNRLALLALLKAQFDHIADLSVLG